MKKLIISITSLFVLIAVIILTQWVYQGRVPLGDLKKSLRPVRVGYLKYGFDWNIIIDKENILRNKGWDVVYTPAVGSPADLVQTYASGQFDIITSSVGMAAKMYEKDVPLRVFGTLLTATGGIVVDNDSTITTVEDLRGKNIGVVIGSSTFQDVMVFLDKGYGINLNKEANIIPVNAMPELTPLIRSGQVDAIIGWEPFLSQLTHLKQYRYVISQQELWEKACQCRDKYILAVYLGRPNFLNDHPTIVSDINSSQAEAIALWADDRTKVLGDFHEMTTLSTDVISYSLHQSNGFVSGLSKSQKISIAKYLGMMRDSGVLKSDVWGSYDKINATFFVDTHQ